MWRITAFIPLILVGAACLRLPTEGAVTALDYRIDRPRVLGINLVPPHLAHGLPVQIDALVAAPPGDAESAFTMDICGLRRDLPVDVHNVACFNEPELVEHVADGLPAVWDPPDLSGIDCGEEPGCVSHVQLLVKAGFESADAYGALDLYLQSIAYEAGAEIPTTFGDEPRELTHSGSVTPGGEVTLTLRIGGVPDGNFRWYVDDGTLLDTGRTTVLRFEGDAAITENRLVIPDDWHGPLRVFVVAQSMQAQMGLTGDQVWSTLTLEVP